MYPVAALAARPGQRFCGLVAEALPALWLRPGDNWWPPPRVGSEHNASWTVSTCPTCHNQRASLLATSQVNRQNEIVVADGAAVVGIDVAADPGATIEGVVTEAAGGLPLEGVRVYAYGQANGGFGDTFTTADGSYTMTGLPADDYDVLFHFLESPYRIEWYAGAADRARHDGSSQGCI